MEMLMVEVMRSEFAFKATWGLGGEATGPAVSG